ncbi:MAG TPA: succinylglutamate desuccinylase [Cryomorphaceae bacterium]|nr:succinylglutamate desuccinylase [Owenweeksia sp.]MBF97497.1 succinylglutamate desuccinylase [Owenweeksia sp.]HAD96884.1 succinylglutamate desuccinylase [Cryomorphaceae bacterium]HCQ16351.1 succinylglutamate desuccinylase [Cryomorphaceae bacterium]|tara:strand:+ start:1041 stop:1982 length:942 start_codon:yes stop_codon:yes gene_type:complete
MQVIRIDGQEISPGEQRYLELNVARLPSGTQITMPVHVYRSKEPGPVVLLSGGMHGDEVNGIEIVRRFLQKGITDRLLKGSIVAMPIINVYGFINFSRDVPDGKDVNRSFPGKEDGSLASMVAHTLTTHILPQVDFGMDFHTGGASRTNFPQIRFEEGDNLAEEIANTFAAPFTLNSPVIKGSFRETAKNMDKTVVVFEGGETLRIDPKTVDEGIKGIKRVLHHFGMLAKAPMQQHKTHYFKESHWVRAEVSGLFRHKKESGKKVKEGQTIGYISSPTNDYSVKVKSPYSGYIIGHNNFPLIHKGDALFHIGF